MNSILIRNAAVVVTMDGRRREIAGGAIMVADNVIVSVGSDE